MPLLKFEVQADYDKVVRLREEITRLNNMLLSMPADTPATAIHNVEQRLSAAKKEFRSLTDAALLAGAELENGFKRRIYDASRSVNDFTERIIAQKTKIREIQQDVKSLGDQYRKLKNPGLPGGQKLKAELESAKTVLEEERMALFDLTQQQASARLSVKRLRDEYALMKKEAGDNTEILEQMKEQLMGMGKDLLGTLGIGFGVKEFIGQMVQVRGEFQQIETSLEVLLGSEEKAAKLMGEVKEFAKVSPLDLKSTATATQMMLGFNIEAEKVPRYLQAIGDISMGNAQRFNSLTLAFSQMSATGKLMGQDLNQMINAGFNPLQIIAEKTGKSIATLKEEMSKGAITSQMVQQAFIDATDAGGKFYQMSEKASKTINGQMSMLQDALDAMFNSLGEQSEGVMLGAIETTTKLVENYETVGKVIAGLVTVYGAYKAALILNITLTRSFAVAARADATAKGIQTIATKAATIAQQGLNAAMKANPYGLAAAAIVAVGSAIWAYSSYAEKAELSQKKLNEAFSKAQGEIQAEQTNIELLFDSLKKAEKGTDEYQKTKDLLISQYGDYLKGLINEKNELIDLEAAYYRVSAAAKDAANSRALESYTKEAQDRFSEKQKDSINKIQEVINKRVDNAHTRNTLMELVRRDMAKNGILSVSTENLLGSAFNESRNKAQLWNKNSGVNQIKELVSEVGSANRTLMTDLQDANIKFGVMSNKFSQFSIEQLSSAKEMIQSQINAGEATDFIITQNGKVIASYEDRAEAELALRKIEDAIKSKKAEDKANSDKNLKNNYDKAVKELNDANAELAKIKSNMKDYTEDDLKKAQQRVETAKTRLKSLDGDPTGKTAKAAQKESDKRLQAEQKASDELLALKRQTQQSEIDIMVEGTQKKLRQIELDYQKQEDTITKQERSFKEQNKKQGIEGLTDEQSGAIEAQRKANKDSRDKLYENLRKQEAQYMRDYLKEYGTFQQQKLAIAEEYNQRIADSDNEWDKRSLAKERDNAVSQVDMRAIESKIDWAQIYTGLGGVASELLKPAIEELEKLMDSESFRNLSADNKKAYAEALLRLKDASGSSGIGGYDFSRLGTLTQEYQKSLTVLRKAQEQQRKAAEAVEQAEKDLADAMKEGEKDTIEFAKTNLDLANKRKMEVDADVDKAQDDSGNAGKGLADAQNNLQEAVDGVTSALSTLSSGSLYGVLRGSEKLIGAINGTGDSFQLLGGKIGGLIGAILQILDALGDDPSQFIENLLDKVISAVDNLLADLASGKLIDVIVTGCWKLVETIVNRIVDFFSFGHLSFNLFGSNAKEVEEITERLTSRNEALADSVDALRQAMDKASGAVAINAARQAEEAQMEYNSNLSAILDAQMGYHGSHHSNNYYIDKALSQQDWRAISAQAGVDVTNTSDLWSLTPEQLKKVSELTDIWDRIIHAGKYDKSEYLDEYLAQAGKIEEITEELKEQLTSVTFDSLRSSFIDSLMDMDKNAKDFAEDWKEYLMRSVIDAKISDLLDSQLKAFYDKWAEYAESDAQLTDTERTELGQMWDRITAEGLRIRDEVASITGYGSSPYSQEASRGYTTELSEDTGAEISGRLTSVAEGVWRIKDLDEERNALLRSMSGISFPDTPITQVDTEVLRSLTARMEEQYTVHSDTRRILAESYLELQRIRQNTSDIVKPIKNMSDKINEIAGNTRNL